MADGGFSINVDLGAILNAGQIINSAVLPRVHEAIGAIAAQGQKNWAHAVMNAPGIWSEEKKAYASSIKWSYVGDFHARVSTDYAKASEIENGRPARDLKLMLNTSMKVRMSKKGTRYLIIPFQHNVPDSGALAPSMPDDIYQLASQLAPSRVIGMGRRVSGNGAWSTSSRAPATVPQRQYSWGDRLDFNNENTWMNAPNASRRYQGMVRFDTSGLGAKRSTYLTFRVMSENSKGWIVPGKPGLNLLQDVVNGLNPVAEKVIAMAVNRDLGG